MGSKYSNQEIKDLLSKIIGKKDIYTKTCVVTAVDSDNLTCDAEPIDGTPEYFDILLSPTSNSTNVSIPNVGSTVFVHFLDDRTPYITQMDSVATSIVRSTGENAEHHTSLRETLNTFADDLKGVVDKMVFTTPNGPTAVGPIETTKQELQKVVEDFKSKVDKLFKD